MARIRSLVLESIVWRGSGSNSVCNIFVINWVEKCQKLVSGLIFSSFGDVRQILSRQASESPCLCMFQDGSVETEDARFRALTPH